VSSFKQICTFVGSFTLLFQLLSFSWTACISYTLYLSVRGFTVEEKEQKIRKAMVIAVLGPFLIFLLYIYMKTSPFIHEDYNPSSPDLLKALCFVAGDEEDPFGRYMLFICFYLPFT
jgi:cytochrome c biogenesis factor